MSSVKPIAPGEEYAALRDEEESMRAAVEAAERRAFEENQRAQAAMRKAKQEKDRAKAAFNNAKAAAKAGVQAFKAKAAGAAAKGQATSQATPAPKPTAAPQAQAAPAGGAQGAAGPPGFKDFFAGVDTDALIGGARGGGGAGLGGVPVPLVAAPSQEGGYGQWGTTPNLVAQGQPARSGETIFSPTEGGGWTARPEDAAAHEAAVEGTVRAPGVLRGESSVMESMPRPQIIMAHPKIGPEPTAEPVATATPEPEVGSGEAVIAAYESDLEGERDTLAGMQEEVKAAARERRKPTFTPTQINAQRDKVREADKDLAQERRRVAKEKADAAKQQEKAETQERQERAHKDALVAVTTAAPKERMKVLKDAVKNGGLTAAALSDIRTQATGMQAQERLTADAQRKEAERVQVKDEARAMSKFRQSWQPLYANTVKNLNKRLGALPPQQRAAAASAAGYNAHKIFQAQFDEAGKHPPERQQALIAEARRMLDDTLAALPKPSASHEPSEAAKQVAAKALETYAPAGQGSWLAAVAARFKGEAVPAQPLTKQQAAQVDAALRAAYMKHPDQVSYQDVLALRKLLAGLVVPQTDEDVPGAGQGGATGGGNPYEGI